MIFFIWNLVNNSKFGKNIEILDLVKKIEYIETESQIVLNYSEKMRPIQWSPPLNEIQYSKLPLLSQYFIKYSY